MDSRYGWVGQHQKQAKARGNCAETDQGIQNQNARPRRWLEISQAGHPLLRRFEIVNIDGLPHQAQYFIIFHHAVKRRLC
jgi:hypothetical protein